EVRGALHHQPSATALWLEHWAQIGRRIKKAENDPAPGINVQDTRTARDQRRSECKMARLCAVVLVVTSTSPTQGCRNNLRRCAIQRCGEFAPGRATGGGAGCDPPSPPRQASRGTSRSHQTPPDGGGPAKQGAAHQDQPAGRAAPVARRGRWRAKSPPCPRP